MNSSIIRFVLGYVLKMEAVLMLLPCIVAVLYREQTGFAYLLVAAVSMAFGTLMTIKKPKSHVFYLKEGCVATALSWIFLSFFGALPFWISGEIPSLIDALFETVSGFTTTGSSILADVEALSHCALFWRSFTHWIGGMGVLVFMLALLPMAEPSSMHLMKAESPGPSVGKLVPKVRSTAKILYQIYFVLTVAMLACMILTGCPLFDSVNLTFATAGTGGFGVLDSSAAEYGAATQWVMTIFMILFGVNFNVYFLFYVKRFKEGMKSEEARAYLGIIASAVLLISVNIFYMVRNLELTVRQAAFQVASIITTTGFSSVDFDLWPEFSKGILVLLMFCGACAGSTGGGMKVSRLCIMAKTVMKELAFIIHPRNVRKTRFEGKTVEHEVLRSINVFLVAYLGIFVLSVMLISLDNFDFATNFTAVAATLNNIGPGLAKVGPTQNFGIYSNFSKLVLAFDMLAGRLEIFPMLVPVIYLLRKKQLS